MLVNTKHYKYFAIKQQKRAGLFKNRLFKDLRLNIKAIKILCKCLAEFGRR